MAKASLVTLTTGQTCHSCPLRGPRPLLDQAVLLKSGAALAGTRGVLALAVLLLLLIRRCRKPDRLLGQGLADHRAFAHLLSI